MKAQIWQTWFSGLVGAALFVGAPLATRGVAQCAIDPASGQQICLRPGSPWQPAARAPVDERPGGGAAGAVSHAAHCRIRVGDGSTGSGTLVARNERAGLVLTCAHLFDDAAANIVVEFPRGERFAGRLIARDRAHDLAALVIHRPEIMPVSVSDAGPAGILAACGYGGDGQFRAVRGAVVGAATPVGAVYASHTMRGAVRPGDSGGAVLDAGGRLVGVVWGQRGGLTYFTGGEPLRALLDRVMNRRQEQIASADPTPSRERDAPGGANGSAACDCELRLAALAARVEEIAGPGWLAGLSYGKLAAGALGLSGPLAAAVIAAGGLARARRARRGSAGTRAAAPAGETLPAAAAPIPAGARDGPPAAAARPPQPIAVDTPPPPQQTVTQTHYVPYETDSFAKAHQWASEQVARKYPGAAELLHTQESLIHQYLSAHHN